MEARDPNLKPTDPTRKYLRGVLREYGLLGPRAVLEEVHTPAMRLREASDVLGVLYGAFCDYLALRPDCFRATDCLAFRRRTPYFQNDQEITALYDPVPDFPEDAFEPVVNLSGPYVLVFHTAGGKQLCVRHPHMVCEDLQARKLLKPLAEVLLHHWGTVCEGLLEDFLSEHAGQVDLYGMRAEMERFTSVDEAAGLRVPKPLRDAVDVPHVLVQLPSDCRPGQPVPRDKHLTVAKAFFGQALDENWFPNDVANLVPDGEGHLVFTGGTITEPGPGLQAHLFGYLMAALAGDVDRTFNHMIHMLRPLHPGADDDVLRHRLRAADAFRDGSWGEDHETLAETLFVQWRFAREAGWGAVGVFAAFQRALVRLAYFNRDTDRASDLIRKALGELRTGKSFSMMRHMATTEGLAQQMESMLEAGSHFPTRLDDLLAKTPQNPKTQSFRTTAVSSAFLPLLCLLMCLPTVARLLSSSPDFAWVESLLTVLFLALGLWLLRLAHRAGT